MGPFHPQRTRPAAMALAVAAALVLGACGSSAPAAPVATTSVNLPASYRFDPAAITVSPGSTVTWTNNDHFTHSVQFLDGGLPSEPLVMEPGATASFRFDQAGTFRYQCHLHPQNMQGTIRVGAGS
jgi:plastocyanin